MPSRTVLRTGLAAAFLLSTSLGLAAPLHITGTVRGETGAVSTAKNVQVELYPAYESYADALRRLTEKQAPVSLAKARVGAGGTYEVLAPEKGCFRVVVRAEGYLPVEIPFLPLVQPVELPAAPLVPASSVEVRTTGSDGRPLAGIAVRVPPSSPTLPFSREPFSPAWQTAELRAVSDGAGRVALLWGRPAAEIRILPRVPSIRDRPWGWSWTGWVGVTGPDGKVSLPIHEGETLDVAAVAPGRLALRE